MTTEQRASDDLAPFVGEWRILAAFGDVPPADIGARVSFEWLPGGRFLIQHWEIPVPEAPDGIAIIGADPKSEGNYLQHGNRPQPGRPRPAGPLSNRPAAMIEDAVHAPSARRRRVRVRARWRARVRPA